MSTMHYFVVSCIGHLENISSLNYTDLPNVDIFIPKYQKIPLIKYYCWFFVKRAFKFGKLSVENVGCKFSKVQSFTWKLNILAINTASCFLEVIGSLFFILKKMAANTQVSVTVVCHQSFFQVNDVSFKKKKKKKAMSMALLSNICTRPFSKDSIIAKQEKCFMSPSHVVTLHEEDALKDRDLINFFLLHQGHLKEKLT